MKKVIILIVCNFLVSQLDAYFIRNFMGMYRIWQKSKNSIENTLEKNTSKEFYAQSLVANYMQADSEKLHDFFKKEMEECSDEKQKNIIDKCILCFNKDSYWNLYKGWPTETKKEICDHWMVNYLESNTYPEKKEQFHELFFQVYGEKFEDIRLRFYQKLKRIIIHGNFRSTEERFSFIGAGVVLLGVGYSIGKFFKLF